MLVVDAYIYLLMPVISILPSIGKSMELCCCQCSHFLLYQKHMFLKANIDINPNVVDKKITCT